MEILVELDALHENLKANPELQPYVTQKQVQGLASLMGQGLEDKSRENRITVLRLLAGPALFDICGVLITSTKNLTGKMASFLIDQLLEPDSNPWRLSEYGRELLSQTEALAKDKYQ